jgi:hypothetical protein
VLLLYHFVYQGAPPLLNPLILIIPGVEPLVVSPRSVGGERSLSYNDHNRRRILLIIHKPYLPEWARERPHWRPV